MLKFRNIFSYLFLSWLFFLPLSIFLLSFTNSNYEWTVCYGIKVIFTFFTSRVPNKLVVLWQRGAHRRRYSKQFDFQPGIAKPYRGVMVWAEEEELDMTCTLYKVYLFLYSSWSGWAFLSLAGLFKSLF